MSTILQILHDAHEEAYDEDHKNTRTYLLIAIFDEIPMNFEKGKKI